MLRLKNENGVYGFHFSMTLMFSMTTRLCLSHIIVSMYIQRFSLNNFSSCNLKTYYYSCYNRIICLRLYLNILSVCVLPHECL